jgi:hypothetical protein
MAGLLELGLELGAASSSSLEGTSNTWALTGEVDEKVLEAYFLGIFSDLWVSSGVMLGDLDSKNWLSCVSGASDLGTGDEKP